MNDSRIALKVGIFAAAGVALMVLLVLSFSRGLTLFQRTERLDIVFESTAGLKPTADVMMSGVTIGKAVGLKLAPDGRSVIVSASILSQYKIHTNALFQIDALGFLGDQYISVTPSTNDQAPYLKDGDQVRGQSPFNMQQAVHSVAGLLDQVKTTVSDADLAVRNLNNTVLAAHSLSNVDVALGDFQAMAVSARQTVQDARDLIQTNAPVVDETMTNLVEFSKKLKVATADLDRLVATNEPTLTQAIKDLRDTSASFQQIAAGLQAGQGLAGGLLKDQEMKTSAEQLISNASALSAAFADFGSNLNQRGIWSMLWKPKHKEGSSAPAR